MLAVAPNLDLVLRDIAPEDIRAHFQPIVDLAGATIAGYEVLSRGPAPFESPAVRFARARALGLTAELEQACHAAALARIAGLGGRDRQWFVNITPDVFCERSASEAAETVRAHGLDPADVVFELTEHDTAVDPDLLRRAIRAHVDEGFRIALDDFGAGSSGLTALATGMPHTIKLDKELARGIHGDPYKQSIVRSVVLLAASVDARLVAEGIETWAELETLAHLGVRFAQGRLLAEPHPEPPVLPASLAEKIRRTVDRARPVRTTGEEAVSRLATESYSVQHGSMTCGQLEAVFRQDPHLDCAVVLHGASPVGVIPRAHLLANAESHAHKPIDTIARPLSLVVDEGASIVHLAALAMKRAGDELYDPVIVVRRGGTYHGTVTIRQLIMGVAELKLSRGAGVV